MLDERIVLVKVLDRVICKTQNGHTFASVECKGLYTVYNNFDNSVLSCRDYQDVIECVNNMHLKYIESLEEKEM